MSAPARLLALRLQGFKSFAERTTVEFGAGISAIVGPNGSGKSNLADALRWALGEQGRALRSRKAEDVIFAGSDRRAALGMADVTLVLDNADGLLPVDFSALELGRRLYRSGENDYLLNRQRVRLRDLVDLLDAANLADNAFLFIGQGMVDQALSLRPEERRPLFEEVAGVRRHERRRRRAEEQLAESEANLARVEDILAELRPQARRLAAQAEQQASRATVGEELAAALLAAAHGRWHGAAARTVAAAEARERAAAALDRALATLARAEEGASAIAADLGERAVQERERRADHDAALAALTELRLREARLAGEVEAGERDRRRLADERSAAEADLALRRREVVAPVPARDVELETSLAETERLLSEALRQLGELRATTLARGDELEALRRAEAARQAEAETARRRLDEADRRLAEERERAAAAGARRAVLDERVGEATRARVAAGEAEAAAGLEREAARAAAEQAEAARVATAERASSLGASVAELTARLAALESRLAEEDSRGIARAARRRGGRRVDEDLVVEAAFRPAVEAALAEAARGYLVAPEAVAALAAERGILVLDDGPVGRRAADERRFRDRLAALGGGVLDAAVTRDGSGAARRLLARAAWLPDLDACLALRTVLPPGWVAVPRDGSAVVGDLMVTVGRPDATLERRAEAARVGAELARAEAELGEARAAAAAASDQAHAAHASLEDARRREAVAETTRRRAEEAERVALRELETVAREGVWHDAQVERLAAEAQRLADAAATTDGEASGDPAASDRGRADPRGVRDALATWESRAAELRERRDRLAEELAGQEAARRDAEARRARVEAAITAGEERIARAEREAGRVDDRVLVAREELTALRTGLARAADAEQRARVTLDVVRAADADARARLAEAERDATVAREAVRVADDRLRSADRAELEARLAIDALREQLLVELAGLGELGLSVLGVEVAAGAGSMSRNSAAGMGLADDVAGSDGSIADEAAALEAGIDRLATVWAAAQPPADAPSPARLAVLRRRYHELGAANPFAVAEYEALRTRLEGLDAQATDLRQAIARTRELIDELNRMIAEQFRATFRALEVAFDERFRQLFGGGFARLSLTDPEDLSATGVEIVARPPGKKAQALAMLSGGERALTAVALLFAMLEVRPVPFCVLDEVDAALDEANVGRFSEALRGLAERTQFIVITHNRGTIEMADALYGVTVGDDSVSRIISLRLDEAGPLAERGPAGSLVDAAVG